MTFSAQITDATLERARLAVTSLQPFGLFRHINLGSAESLIAHVAASEIADYEPEDLEAMDNAHFDNLLLNDDPATLTFTGDARPEEGELGQLIVGCARLAGPGFPAIAIEEYSPKRGFGVRWTCAGTTHKLEVDGPNWGPTDALNAAVRGGGRFYEGPVLPAWYLFWLTDEQRDGVRAARGWQLFG